MTSAKSQSRKPQNAEEADFPFALWLTRAAFILSLAIVLTRVTMMESLRDAIDATPGSDPVPRAPGPATSLVLDLLAWLPALLILGRGVIDRAFHVRLSWTHGLLAALAAWTVLSTAWADDKFAALVSGFHFLSAAVFLWSTSQLVRSWRRLRIVSGVIIAVLLIYGSQALSYRYVERAEMQKDWAQNREKRLRDRGLDPNSFSAQQFEAKLLRGEMIGFDASPNTFAAVTVLLMVVTIGVVVQRRADGGGVGWLIPPVVGLTVGVCIIVWCDSKTAFVTPIIAGGALAAYALFRARVASRARLIYAAGVVCFVLGTAAVVGHGLYHGSLVIDSMTFRWRYWVGAAHVFAGHPLRGVGWDNLGQHYLAARLPIAAEEIRDPHNFIVRFFAELGIVGGFLALAWQLRLWWELTQPPVAEPAVEEPPPRRALPASFAVVIAGLVLSVLATVDFGFMSVGAGDAGPAFVTLQLLQRLAGGILAIAGVWSTTVRAMDNANLDDRPAPWVLYAIIAGLGVFVLHNLVDFSLFEVGPMFLFALLAGSALGMRLGTRGDGVQRISSKRRVTALALGVILWLVALVTVAMPVLVAEDHSSTADEALRRGAFRQAAQSYEEAAAAVPYNAEYWFHAAKTMTEGGGGLEQARQAFDKALKANPSNAANRFSRASFEAALPNPDVAAVRANYDRALEIDPANVPQRLGYAQTMEKLGLPAEARKQYETSLTYDDQLSPVEVERLPAAKVAEIRAKIERLPH